MASVEAVICSIKKEQSEVKLSFARVGQVVAVRLLRVGSSSGSQAKVLNVFARRRTVLKPEVLATYHQDL